MYYNKQLYKIYFQKFLLKLFIISQIARGQLFFMKYLLGIDVGTSGTKTALFDTKGTVIASSTFEYPMSQPQNGWAEQNPEDWWQASVNGIKSVIEKSGVSGEDIAGIGLSGQMHSLVMLDENNNVLRPAILWCDGRTTEECEEIHNIIGKERLIEITANPALAGFTSGKILWVRKHEPEIYAKCKHILLPKDYIRLKLANVYATEVSDASGMGLLDVPNRCWADEVLEKLNIDKSLLAKVYESPEVTGYVTEEIAKLTGLKAGTPVVGGAGDNAAAAVGTGVVEDGKAFATIGTSGVVFAHTDKLSIDPKGRVHTFCCAVPNAWHVMGVTLSAGASLQWFRNQLCENIVAEAKEKGVDPYEIMTALAETSPIGSNRLIFSPYLMGERTPHLDSNCRGSFTGLSAIHTRADMIRAVMEGVTFSLRDCQEILKEMNVSSDKIIACGGGSASPFWRQMIADIMDCPVTTVSGKEGPAFGAAILAGVGAGIYESVPAACKEIIKEGEAKQSQNSAEYDKYYELYKMVYPALKEMYHKLINA